MGRIKTSFVKSLGRQVFERHSQKFTTDYGKNKEILKQVAYIQSKKLRNIVAGYITTLKKQRKA